ncbi:hypothetical protein llg_11810 [Luteolibacter sp. LG18]|nr:hypothetical protein llg_11810 [Luteolibacter sp. LG18]
MNARKESKVPRLFGILMLLGGCGMLALAIFGHARGGGESPWYVWLFPWPFLAIGVGGILYGKLSARAAIRSTPTQDDLGRVILPGGTGRVRDAIPVVVGAIAMNCLAWTFVGVAWQEWAKGKAPWILLLVTGGAVVAGAAVAWRSLQQVLGCFAPTFDLCLEPSPRKGGATSFQWHRRRGTWPVRQFTFELVGVKTIQSAAGQSPSQTVTDRFHREELANVPCPEERSASPIPISLPSVALEAGASLEWGIQLQARYRCGLVVRDGYTLPLRNLDRCDLPMLDLPERRVG